MNNKINFEWNGKNYSVSYNANRLTVTRDGKTKTAKVINDGAFIFKLQKTQIRARDGAYGLFAFCKNNIDKNFGECWNIQICDYVIDKIKEC